MNSRFTRKIILLILFNFAIIGAIYVLNSLGISLAFNRMYAGEESESEVYSPPVDVPYVEEPTERLELISLGGGGWNTVMCWPSVGGIIVNTHVSSVELDFLNLPRFQSAPRSSNASEEDEFCRQLRRTGAKWWSSHGDFIEAVNSRLRPTSAKEREALILGWPKDGGVWVLKEANWYDFAGSELGIWRMGNAFTMEERCAAMEMAGAVYYKDPYNCESVKPLLDGFGEHEREEMSKYYFDYPKNSFGQW